MRALGNSSNKSMTVGLFGGKYRKCSMNSLKLKLRLKANLIILKISRGKFRYLTILLLFQACYIDIITVRILHSMVIFDFI